MTLSDTLAVLAMLAMATALGDMRVACALFVTYCAQLHLVLPANIPQYIRYWALRLTADGAVDHHAGNAGRPPSISAQMVEAAYQGLINWKKAGKDRPYASIPDAAANCPEVKEVLRDSGVSPDWLFELMQQAHPHLRWGKVTVRWRLTDDNKAKRVSVCNKLKRMYSHLLHRMVFVDAKTICMCEEEIKGWMDTSVPGYAEGIKPAMYKKKIIRLKYYAAVHCKLGPVFLKYYTGTSGMDHTHDGHNYQVRSGYEHLRRAPTPHMTHSLCQLGSPTSVLRLEGTDVLVNTQPQHTFSLGHCCLSIQLILQLPDNHAAVSVVGLSQ